MLPPVGAGARIERRSRARRAADDGLGAARPASGVGPEAVEAPFAADAEPETFRRPPRRGGRRASDGEKSAEAGPSKAARAPRPFAPLVAQIIANVMGLEQTRTRRRASIAEAEALYRPKRERPKRPRGEA